MFARSFTRGTLRGSRNPRYPHKKARRSIDAILKPITTTSVRDSPEMLLMNRIREFYAVYSEGPESIRHFFIENGFVCDMDTLSSYHGASEISTYLDRFDATMSACTLCDRSPSIEQDANGQWTASVNWQCINKRQRVCDGKDVFVFFTDDSNGRVTEDVLIKGIARCIVVDNKHEKWM